jgi:hypothetical protein
MPPKDPGAALMPLPSMKTGILTRTPSKNQAHAVYLPFVIQYTAQANAGRTNPLNITDSLQF